MNAPTFPFRGHMTVDKADAHRARVYARRAFSSAEDEELRRLCRLGVSTTQIGILMKRPQQSVWQRAFLLGLPLATKPRKAPAPPSDNRRLTAAEEAVVRTWRAVCRDVIEGKRA